MENNVLDPEARRMRTERDRRDEIASQTHQRLNAAPDVAEALKKTHRTDLGDRRVFASNLGRMWREAFPVDSAPPLLSLFERVFGEEQGPTQYKKRARFVRLDGEDSDGTLNAHGRHFVEIAVAIAVIAHAGQSADAIRQAEQRAILQLVEGSSFDRRRPPAARLRDEAVEALIDCFDRILKRVEAEVDLAEMRATIQQDALAAVIDGDGKIDRLCEVADQFEASDSWRSEPSESQEKLREALGDRPESGWTKEDREDSSALMQLGFPRVPNELPASIWESDLDLGDPDSDAVGRVSLLAPKVFLGDVFSPLTSEGVAILDIDEDAIEQQLRDAMTDYGNALVRHGLSASAPGFDRQRVYRRLLERAVVKALARRLGYPDDWIEEECDCTDDLRKSLEEDDLNPPSDPWIDAPIAPIYARRRMELQLAFDQASDRWRLTLALVHGVGRHVYQRREDAYGIQRAGEPFEPSFNLGRSTGLVPDRGSLFVHRVGPGRLMLFAEDFPEPVLGIGGGCLVFPSEPCLEALLSMTEYDSVDGHRVALPFEEYWGRPAPAGWCTLAGLILRNLAYAPDAERYDLQLLADAKAKAKMVADLAKARRETFLSAIKRIER